MSTPYLITFTPVNRFFFGSSHSFAEGFYVESMKYPQPTTILGCLRNTILIQKDIVKDDGTRRNIPDIENDAAKKLTGTSVINGLDDNDDNFGVIERVSPVFIVKQKNSSIEDILFPVPADIEGKDKFYRSITYKRQDNAISSYSGMKKSFAILSDKNPKLPSLSSLGGKDFWSAYWKSQQIPNGANYPEDKIFKTHISVGIGCENKDAGDGKFYFKKTTIEGMFYTKIDYSLHKDYSFGVIVWLSEEVLNKGIIMMGGERSVFNLDINEIKELSSADGIFSSHPVIKAIMNGNCDLFQNLTAYTNKDKLVALSPLVFDESINSSLKDIMEHRIIQGIQSMRMLKPGVRVSGKGEKSESVCMIPAGSVLYSEKSIRLTGWKIPYKIGYNHVIKTKRG